MGRSGGNKKISKAIGVPGTRLRLESFYDEVAGLINDINREIILEDPVLGLAIYDYRSNKKSHHFKTTDQNWIDKYGSDIIKSKDVDFNDLPKDVQDQYLDSAEASLKRLASWGFDLRLGLRRVMSTRPTQDAVALEELMAAQTDILSEKIIDGFRDHQANGSKIEPIKRNLIFESAEKIKEAEAQFSAAEKFAKEARAITEYAKWASKQSGQTPEEIIEHIANNQSEYLERIPEIAENKDLHSAETKKTVASLAKSSYQALNRPREDYEADPVIEEYLQKESAKKDRVKIAQDMKKEALKNAANSSSQEALNKVLACEAEIEIATNGLKEAKAIAEYIRSEADQTGKSIDDIAKDIEDNRFKYKAGIKTISGLHTKTSWQKTVEGAKDIVLNNPKSSLDDYIKEQSSQLEKAKKYSDSLNDYLQSAGLDYLTRKSKKTIDF